MKKYVIKKDFPGSKIGDVWIKAENGFMSPEGRESIKMHEHLFKPFNDWFEDYEESKEYWFINDLDGEPMKCELRYCKPRHFTEWLEKRKQIGNYFKTDEEAEKAVEKLKAWRRLQDKGFKFTGLGIDSWDRDDIKFEINLPKNFDELAECQEIKDLNLLFGGKE